MTTWAHNCDSTGKFSLIPLGEECKSCGINNAVSSMRHAGHVPLPIVKKQEEKPKKRLAALFMPFNKPTSNKEYDTEFYDRHG